MNKKFKFKNTIVIGFNDIEDPKRKEITHLFSQGIVEDWCLFTAAYDVLDNKGVEVGDLFRDINRGSSIKIIEVGYSLENHAHFAVCADCNISIHHRCIKYFDELLNIKIWAKMGQHKENEDG